MKGNFHTHTRFCDGKNTAQEMAERALELGFTQLGFSGHMDPDIRMDLPAYNREVCRLQDLYRGRLDILRGVELDGLYVPRSAREADLLEDMEYRIGSTHFITDPHGGLPGAVDDTPDRLEAFCREAFGGDYYRLARAYYEEEAEVFARTRCTFVGHFDLVTRFNDDLHFLDESDPRYLEPALEAMEYLVSLGLPLEINCGAVNRGRKAELYPNRAMLRKLREMGGQILINSDAHHRDLLDGGFDIAICRAMACGFTHTNFLVHDAQGKVAFRQVPLDGYARRGK